MEKEEKQEEPKMEEKKMEEKDEKGEQDKEKGYFFDDRIRMANLGYQYDWPHRCYPKTQVPIP